jgi:hypothetical protein
VAIITAIAVGIAAVMETPFARKKNAPKKKVRNVLTKEIVKKNSAQVLIVVLHIAAPDIAVQGFGATGIAKAAAAATIGIVTTMAMAITTTAVVATNPICRL